MKPKKIIIAAVLILTISALLSGCKLVESNTEKKPAATENGNTQVIQDLVKKAEAVQKDVKLVLTPTKTENQLKLSVALDNPSQKPVTSVQAWLSFDAQALQGKDINATKSAFTLVAPYDNAFDNTNGLVMIGRSNPAPVKDKSISVAEITFDLLKNETAMIEAYDYRDDLNGHTSVNILVDGKPYNVLSKPDSPALIIEK